MKKLGINAKNVGKIIMMTGATRIAWRVILGNTQDKDAMTANLVMTGLGAGIVGVATGIEQMNSVEEVEEEVLKEIEVDLDLEDEIN